MTTAYNQAQAGPDREKVAQLSRKLQAAEAEVVRLRLRIDGRPVPYYTVLKEFFPSKQDKFVPPDHTCICNDIYLLTTTFRQYLLPGSLLAEGGCVERMHAFGRTATRTSPYRDQTYGRHI